MKFLSLLLAAAAPVIAQTWQNVKIGGGGGFIPSIVFHPKEKGLAYARTDIGGIYKLNADDSWTPITDFIADNAKWNRWGVDALALDPSNANVVLAAFGMYTIDWDSNNGAIGRSTDRGKTWTFSELPFKVGGNMPGRGMGERLAVDPINSNIVFFGARSGKGLWKSTDAGKTFKKVNFPNPGTFIPDPSGSGGINNDIQGLAFVTFDESSKALNGATSRIFVGTADTRSASVYVSNDAGATFTAVAKQPIGFLPHKGRISPKEGVLYVTYSDGTGPYDGAAGAVYKYNIATGAWTNITPVSGAALTYGFGGLALDAQKPGTIMVASLNSWWPDAQLFRSTDSGATWSTIWTFGSNGNVVPKYSMTAAKAPWINNDFYVGQTKILGWMIESLEIDPLDRNHWLWGTGLTLNGGRDLTNWDSGKNVNVASLADGIEEFAVLALSSAPGGSELFAGVHDDSGFTFKSVNDLKTSPKTAWNTPMFVGSSGVDYAGNSVKNVVRVGNVRGEKQLATSSDGGVTWALSAASDTNSAGGTVALSADAKTVVWSTAGNGVRRTVNNGALSAVSGLPANAVIASDKRTATVFYGGSDAFYVSKDSGATFSRGGALSGASVVRGIAAHPIKAGEVWASTNVGVFRSTNSGASFTRVSTAITDAYEIALGVSATGWNAYVFGQGPAGAKLYGSSNNGATWVDIQGTIGFGSMAANQLAGSANSAGVVYVGTNGRGVFYNKVSI
ncbi:Cel74a [Plectosphaerella cucumerina]|uniref:Cel74a n=1 Tax=Plectosphaerella cucumerina TaxID=40658 RepID=A0A8K0TQK3_9PEZI|nr:Cel74a [Plectosphaerella cucumerina]